MTIRVTLINSTTPSTPSTYQKGIIQTQQSLFIFNRTKNGKLQHRNKFRLEYPSIPGVSSPPTRPQPSILAIVNTPRYELHSEHNSQQPTVSTPTLEPLLLGKPSQDQNRPCSPKVRKPNMDVSLPTIPISGNMGHLFSKEYNFLMTHTFQSLTFFPTNISSILVRPLFIPWTP